MTETIQSYNVKTGEVTRVPFTREMQRALEDLERAMRNARRLKPRSWPMRMVAKVFGMASAVLHERGAERESLALEWLWDRFSSRDAGPADWFGEE